MRLKVVNVKDDPWKDWVPLSHPRLPGLTGYYVDTDGSFIGLVRIYINYKGTEIADLFIMPSVRGKGYGRKLLKSFLLSVDRRGYTSIWLWTHSNNTKAINLYKSLNFKISRITPTKIFFKK